MKILRYERGDEVRFGLLEGENIRPLAGDPFGGVVPAEEPAFPLSEARLLAPVCPGKILAIGFNYRDHAKELGRELPTEPNVFTKPTSALTNPGDPILLPSRMTKRVDYEGELVAVIGKTARHVSEEDAPRYVLGYTCGNDVSARDLQSPTGQWTICKGFDTFAPLGPWIETDADPFNLPIETRVNGEIKQRSNTGNLIFSVPFLVSYLSDVMTLFPGDVIYTGTPFGISPVQEGDTVEIDIGGIGVLRNPVRKELE